ncbi:serine/arginine repetitive matrix protein 1-like isoform X2 [Macrosteles quadrilineatus]|uniref:serine/arginine repetitive matrix protein 1-like isoform X2 n=1 Tax=Macrosteles quadrilineatus TaxID=74068 RepID=UPI0023E34CEC|nr:serine/arginine repetitive matrix protein 1-like isoform X2 [Macrosteles quadrilineatus]
MDDVQWRFSHGSKVEAKYCPIEIDGDVKYYICPRNEICCTFGCCISSNFHFYQLWYYWLMVILMFLLCSGGTWWYRYWLHEGHYPRPPPPPNRPQLRRPPPTRVAYHAGRNTVVVQQIWKPQRNTPVGFPNPPPAYSLVQGTSEVTQSSRPGEVSSQLAKLKPSAYYQMYGPPPSYESVVSENHRHHSEQMSPDVVEQSSNTVCEPSTVDQVTQTHNTHSPVQSTSRSPVQSTSRSPHDTHNAAQYTSRSSQETHMVQSTSRGDSHLPVQSTLRSHQNSNTSLPK